MRDAATEVPWYATGLPWLAFYNAYLFVWVSVLLTIGAAIGLFLRPAPRAYARVVEWFAIGLLVSSMVVAAEYLMELWIGLYAASPFEVTVFRSRFSGLFAVY